MESPNGAKAAPVATPPHAGGVGGERQRALIAFERVDLGYGKRHVLEGLTFTLHAGDYVGIVGPNGAGKTTLLKGILGVLRPQAGHVRRDPPPPTPPESGGVGGGTLRFGYVPQLHTIDEVFPLTALDVALMGRYPRIGLFRRPGKADRARALEALEQVGIADAAGRLYRDLSGGQKQRTLMARALASDPDILVLDEPTNDMDIAAERATMELIDRLHAECGLTILMVSHMLNVVVGHARQVAFLGAGAFRILPVAEAATAEHLRALYGIPVQVAEAEGRRIVLW